MPENTSPQPAAGRRPAAHRTREYIGAYIFSLTAQQQGRKITRSQAVARIADRTAKNCRGHVI